MSQSKIYINYSHSHIVGEIRRLKTRWPRMRFRGLLACLLAFCNNLDCGVPGTSRLDKNSYNDKEGNKNK